MSEKARDGQGRWRSKTIAFRISPEENELLEDFVRLTGLTKQEYIIRRVLEREVIILPNPRVRKALKGEMTGLCEVLAGISKAGDLSSETIAVLEFIGKIYDGLTDEKS